MSLEALTKPFPGSGDQGKSHNGFKEGGCEGEQCSGTSQGATPERENRAAEHLLLSKAGDLYADGDSQKKDYKDVVTGTGRRKGGPQGGLGDDSQGAYGGADLRQSPGD